jgi:Transposase
MEQRVLGEIQKDKWRGWARIAEDIGDTSSSTVQRIAKKNGIGRRVAIRKPVISKLNVKCRMVWATENINTIWETVVFTDETTIEMGKHTGKRYVSRRSNEQLDPSNFASNYTSGKKLVMYWGTFTYYGKSRLVELTWPEVVVKEGNKPKRGGFTNKQYAEQIISIALTDFYTEQLIYAGYEFDVLEDSAPVHKGPFVQEARSLFPYDNFTHPASSPDLNPIENVWHLLKDRIWKIQGAYTVAQKIAPMFCSF